jgi:hypothetical protein
MEKALQETLTPGCSMLAAAGNARGVAGSSTPAAKKAKNAGFYCEPTNRNHLTLLKNEQIGCNRDCVLQNQNAINLRIQKFFITITLRLLDPARFWW